MEGGVVTDSKNLVTSDCSTSMGKLGRRQITKGSTHARPSTHMQPCSAVHFWQGHSHHWT